MKTLQLLLAAVCLTSAVFSASFSIPAKSVASQRAKLIREGRYHDFLVKQNAARMEKLNSGSQPFIDYFDSYYLGNITVGTPAQTLTVVLDTGSANLWVIDSACTSQACNGDPATGISKHKFDPTKSSTYVAETRKFSMVFSTGSCSGHYAKETISMGGLTIKNQELGIAEQLSHAFGEQPVDGILGLGWPALAVDQITPPMQNLLPQLDLPLFTVWLDRMIHPTNGGNGGLITYGALDSVNCDAQVDYVPLTAKTYWQFAMDGFQVGDFKEMKKADAISDTGTSWIGAPPTVVSAIIKATKATFDWNTELYSVDCSTMMTQPDLTFIIGGKNYVLNSVEYILDLGLGNGKCTLAFFGMTNSGFGPSWIMGDAFIRQYCNVYDIGNSRIGFAKAHHSF